MKTMNEKLEGLMSKKPSGWLKKAQFRRENRKWLGYSSNIARRAYAVMEDKEGMNQKTLAEKLGVKPQYISKLLKGEQNLSLQTIGKLSEALGEELISFPEYKYSKPLDQNNYALSETINTFILLQFNIFIEQNNVTNVIGNSKFISSEAVKSLVGNVIGYNMQMLIGEKKQYQENFTYSNS